MSCIKINSTSVICVGIRYDFKKLNSLAYIVSGTWIFIVCGNSDTGTYKLSDT